MPTPLPSIKSVIFPEACRSPADPAKKTNDTYDVADTSSASSVPLGIAVAGFYIS